MTDITQRAKEILSTATDGEIMAMITIIGATHSMRNDLMSGEILVMRGTFASTDMSVEELRDMRKDVAGGLMALQNASGSLLDKLDSLLEEAGESE